MITMSSPDITDAEYYAVADVLDTPTLSMGPRIEAFERAVANYVGTSHAVAINSGTSGLHLALIAAGVGPGDEVITSPFSFIASANAIMYVGARPVFVDVDPVTGNIGAGQVEEAITADTWVILPVHVFGQPCDMYPILQVARNYGLLVIEDACEALGAEYKGRQAGSIGDLAVFGFYPNKQITTGEGGMIIADNARRADLCRALRNQGRTGPRLDYTELGYNYRMDEMSAALGLAQMGRIDELLAKRERVVGWYNERLEGMELVARPIIAATTTKMSWFVYVVRILPPACRNDVMDALEAMGIPSRVYFQPIHLTPLYRKMFGYKRGDFPVAEHLGDVSLALPFSGVMTEDDVDTACDALRKVLA